MIGIVVGTRPEFIKMSPVIKELQKQNKKFFIVHTGQHYDYAMNDQYFKDLKIPKPKHHWGDAFCHATIDWMIDIFEKEKPEIVLIEGDTNSVMCGALAALRSGIKIGHVEAGLRSFDWRMTEEHNRIMVDHISDYCFAPTKIAVKNLLKEGISKEKIFLVGNTISDAVQKEMFSKKMEFDGMNSYIFATIHRAENVDDERVLKNILDGIERLTEILNKDCFLPIHPRTKKNIKKFKIKISNRIRLIEPLDYLSCLNYEANASLIISDSGGVLEESCILGTPCITVRDKTDRPEAIKVGANILAGTSAKGIVEAGLKMINAKRNWKHPYGKDVAKKILRVLKYEGIVR